MIIVVLVTILMVKLVRERTTFDAETFLLFAWILKSHEGRPVIIRVLNLGENGRKRETLIVNGKG